MNKIDWSTYKIHCSSLPAIMTNSRKKGELLSETAKAYLREMYIKETFGRVRLDSLTNRYMRKGIECETDSLELVERVTGKKYFKNQEQIENDFITGTPDVKNPDLVDIKTSWDLFTFAAVDEKKATKDYFWQLAGYAWILGREKAHLTYCLVNTPEIMITDELYRLSFKVSEKEAMEYRNNFIFDDIDENMRVKSFVFNSNESFNNDIKDRVIAARVYLQTINL